MLTHTHITVLIRGHEGKAHLYHDKQGMEIPYDNGRILFKRNPVSRGLCRRKRKCPDGTGYLNWTEEQ